MIQNYLSFTWNGRMLGVSVVFKPNIHVGDFKWNLASFKI